MRNSYILVTLILFVFLTGFRTHQDWIIYSSAEGKYSVSYPGTPAEQTQKIPSVAGELTMYISILEGGDTDDNIIYMAAYSEYPADKVNSDMSKESLERFFKGAAEGGARNMNGKVASITEDGYKGFPARLIVSEIKLEDADFLCLQRIILVKNKVYVLQTITKPDKKSNANGKKFFDSFGLSE